MISAVEGKKEENSCGDRCEIWAFRQERSEKEKQGGHLEQPKIS